MSDSADDIMDATYRALCRHGYADLTMQRIADESEVSKAALHYHYDTKSDLLRAFLDRLVDRFEEEVCACDAAGPRERLERYFEAVFAPAIDAGDEGFATALLEVKAQAPYEDAYRDRLVALDRTMRETLEDIVAEGVETGAFREVEAGEVAQFVVTAIDGGHCRQVALGESPAETRRLVESWTEQTLRPGDAAPGRDRRTSA